MTAVRGTITRRLDAVLYELQSEFISLCDIRDFNAKLGALMRAGKSDRASKLKQLLRLFDACGISYELGRENEYYVEQVRAHRSKIPRSIEDRIVYALYNRYRDYPSPEDYMKRLVDRLCDPGDPWEKDTLRVRILKQFIKYGGCLSYQRLLPAEGGKKKKEKVTLYGGEAYLKKYLQKKLGRSIRDVAASLSGLDDDVFDVLDAATKAQKKPSGPYGLLKIVDDLADGRFRVGGGTKKSLYLFAMVYGMTFSSSDAEADPKRDIEINLFRDYYTNNLLRFISDAYRGKLCEYELDPSGQGINYKNFAEMVYLYYIAKDISPEEKIRASDEMIEEIQNIAYSKGKAASERTDETAYYRGLFKGGKDLLSTDVLGLSEADFKEFLLQNYDCDTAAGAYSVSEMQLEAEQNTAFRIYNSILEKLIDEKRWAEDPKTTCDFADLPAKEREAQKDYWLSQCNYGLWFMDAAAFKKKTYQSICDRRPDIDREKFTEFMELLFGVNSFMGHTVAEEVSQQSTAEEWDAVSSVKTKALFVSSARDVTRTSLIVAYYYYYNTLHEDDGDEKWKSFKEVFSDFKQDLDRLLEAAYYQPLSGRNLFDVLVVFSSYAYLNL